MGIQNDIQLSDIIDVKFMQRIQDAFSKAFGFASITLDLEKNFTKDTNFTDFCIKCTRGTDIGFKRCVNCDLEGGKSAAMCGYPVIYSCHAGLTDFAVPIMLKDRQIGSILCGQVLTRKPNEEHYRKIARELGCDEEEYVEALRKVEIVPFEKLETAANSLYLIANTLSEIAYNNYLLKQKSKREAFISKISAEVNASYDGNKIFKTICAEAAKALDVQRAFILKIENNSLSIMARYESKDSPPVKNDVNLKNISIDAIIYSAKALNMIGNITVFNSVKEIPEFIREPFERYGLKSALVTNVIKEGDAAYLIFFEEYIQDRQWLDSDLKFVKIVGQQLSIALMKVILYNKLQLQFEREKAMLSNQPYASWLKDAKGRYLAVNEMYLRNENFVDENQVLGFKDSDLYPKEKAEKIINVDNKIIKEKQPYKEQKLMRLGHIDRWVEIHKTPIIDFSGNISAIAGVMRDITDEKEIEKVKSEFISTVSHELRTPLTAIRGGLSLVLNGIAGEISPKVEELLTIADNNSLRLLNLINDILDLEKMEAGRMVMEIEEYSLDEILKESVLDIAAYADKFDVCVNYENLAEDLKINTDKSRLMQVIANLLSNAIKFSKPMSSVDIKSIIKDDKVRITVYNYEEEIPETYREILFNKFMQVDSSDKRRKGGTGLGLSISKDIVNLLGGIIDYTSNSEVTEFFIEFPVNSEDNK